MDDLTHVWRLCVHAVHLVDNYEELSVDFLGRRALDREGSFTLEFSGRWLSYQLQHDGGFVFVRLREMDAAEEWQTVLNLPDTAGRWSVIHDLIAGLEKYGVNSLKRPIQIGETWDDDCTVIS
jgi:hypothetical protein